MPERLCRFFGDQPFVETVQNFDAMAHLERGGSLVFEVGKMHARTSVPQTVVFPLNRFRLRLLFFPALFCV